MGNHDIALLPNFKNAANCPFFPQVIVCNGLYHFDGVKMDDYVYPEWAVAIGWLIATSSIVLIPMVAIGQLAMAEGNPREVRM